VAAQFAGHGPSVGWLISSFGVGAAVGFVVFSLLRRVVGVPALVSGGLLSMAVGLALLAVFTTGWVALLCFAAVGVGLSLGTTSTSLLIQQRVPDYLRGRVMALWLTCFVGARPVAGILVGAAADLASQGAALAFTACVALLGALVCTPRRLGGAPPPATAGAH
jgi:MFS family permease